MTHPLEMAEPLPRSHYPVGTRVCDAPHFDVSLPMLRFGEVIATDQLHSIVLWDNDKVSRRYPADALHAAVPIPDDLWCCLMPDGALHHYDGPIDFSCNHPAFDVPIERVLGQLSVHAQNVLQKRFVARQGFVVRHLADEGVYERWRNPVIVTEHLTERYGLAVARDFGIRFRGTDGNERPVAVICFRRCDHSAPPAF